MEVKVRVATILLRKAEPPLGKNEFPFTLEDGSDVRRLISDLGLPEALVGSVTVNRKRCPLERTLEEGDAVAIVPAISGG